MIHHVQLGAPPGSEVVARAFWVDLLGFTEVEKPPILAARGGCWFRLDAVEIHVGIEDPFSPARKAHPALGVTGLERWAKKLSAAGYALAWDADLPGMHRFYVHDPFGNRLEFLEPAA